LVTAAPLTVSDFPFHREGEGRARERLHGDGSAAVGDERHGVGGHHVALDHVALDHAGELRLIAHEFGGGLLDGRERVVAGNEGGVGSAGGERLHEAGHGRGLYGRTGVRKVGGRTRAGLLRDGERGDE
jgi:hypothetical protein